jgi:hypothetical protein
MGLEWKLRINGKFHHKKEKHCAKPKKKKKKKQKQTYVSEMTPTFSPKPDVKSMSFL